MVSAEKRPNGAVGTSGADRPTRRLPWWVVAAVIAAVVGGGVWLWEEVVEDRVFPKRWGVVAEGAVYRSGQLSPSLVERTLRGHGIRVIVDLTAERPDLPPQQAQAEAVKKLGIDWQRFPLRGDGTGDVVRFADAIEAVHEARRQGRPVLVHCAAGAQRTGAVIGCYRVLVEGWSARETVAEMARYDWDRRKDAELLTFLDEHMTELAGLLVERGVIERLPDALPGLADEARP